MTRRRNERDAVFAGVEAAAAKIAAGSKSGLRPARVALTEVRALRTILPGFDRASRVGGMPLERAILVHGPSGAGKTRLALAFIRSVLEAAGFAYHGDAERTTPFSWPRQYIGKLAESNRYFASRPDTYEQARKEIREILTNVIRLKKPDGKKGPQIDPLTPVVLVIDSLKKLMPKDLWSKIHKLEEENQQAQAQGAKPEDLERRIGQIKALMNAAFLDEQIPLLEKAGATLVMIGRETEKVGATASEKRRGQNYVVGGGAHVYYDASMVIRVEGAGQVYEKAYDPDRAKSDKNRRFGDRNKITIRKTKVSGHEDREEVGYFYTSNGVLVPEGFDSARDLVTMGKEAGVVESKGSWLNFQGHRWQGEHPAVRWLTEHPFELSLLDAAVRETFMPKPVPVLLEE